MSNGLRTYVRGLIPDAIAGYWRRRKIAAIRSQNRGRKAEDIFSDIYTRNSWGGERGTFNSGSGSTESHAVMYADMVRRFVRERGIRRIVDLGCGDFRIGRQLLDEGVEYVGVDIVEPLVQQNRRLYGTDRVSFAHVDIIEGQLPPGDLCLIRQVLQHLSNAQISRVLENVAQYQYVIVTEHYPAPDGYSGKNLDKPCGEDVRVYDGSAVYLDAPPFSRALLGPLLDVDAGHHLMHPGERLRTYLMQRSPPASADVRPSAP